MSIMAIKRILALIQSNKDFGYNGMDEGDMDGEKNERCHNNRKGFVEKA